MIFWVILPLEQDLKTWKVQLAGLKNYLSRLDDLNIIFETESTVSAIGDIVIENPRDRVLLQTILRRPG